MIKMSWLRQPTRPRDASRTHVRRASRCSKAITCCRAFEAISSTSSAATKRRTLNSKRLRGWLATMPKDRQRRWRSWTALRYRPQSSPGRGNAKATARDWSRISELYAELVAVVPSPVIELNRSLSRGRKRSRQNQTLSSGLYHYYQKRFEELGGPRTSRDLGADDRARREVAGPPLVPGIRGSSRGAAPLSRQAEAQSAGNFCASHLASAALTQIGFSCAVQCPEGTTASVRSAQWARIGSARRESIVSQV
jgi:hypothetical protein